MESTAPWYLTSALGAGEWLASCAGHLTGTLPDANFIQVWVVPSNVPEDYSEEKISAVYVCELAWW